MIILSKETGDRDSGTNSALRAGVAIAIGVATGVIFGVAFENVAIGIATGLVFGGAGGAGLGNVTRAFRRRSVPNPRLYPRWRQQHSRTTGLGIATICTHPPDPVYCRAEGTPP